jgi:DNA repair exonuclease SbcCD ATPase subunit
MPRTVTCPSCSATGELASGGGGRVACPICDTVFDPAGAGDTAAPRSGILAGWGVSLDAAAVAAAPSNAWISSEAEKFAAYVKQELTRLAQARRETADAVSRAEAARVTKAIDLARQTSGLTGRLAAVGAREAEVARKAAELDRREADLVRREQAAAERDAKRARLERDANDLTFLVADLRVAVDRLVRQRDDLEARKAADEERHATLMRRLIDVGRAEVSIQRRADELDELEATLRAEFEARERELERTRLVLAAEAAALRGRPAGDPTPPPFAWRDGA